VGSGVEIVSTTLVATPLPLARDRCDSALTGAVISAKKAAIFRARRGIDMEHSSAVVADVLYIGVSRPGQQQALNSGDLSQSSATQAQDRSQGATIPDNGSSL
jgi:hypothetical protein